MSDPRKHHPPLFSSCCSPRREENAAKPIHEACNRFAASRCSGFSRVKLHMRRLVWPFRALQAALACYRSYGQGCRAHFGVSPMRQWRDLARLALLHSVPPACYYTLHLFERRGHPAEYLYDFETYPFLNALVRDPKWFDAQNSKSCFAAFCAEHELPCVPTFGLLEKGRWTPQNGCPFPPASSFIAKPDRGAQGQGVDIFDPLPGGGYRAFDGRRFTGGETAEHLNRRSDRSTLILQPRIPLHPGFAALSNGALATLRVITLQETQDAPSLWFPRFNLPVGLNTSDNMHSAGGGIASPVDLQSARLGPASGKEVLGDYQDSHPDTGTSITGFTLPGFHEAVALARKAHAAMPGLPTAGWDIAITPDGPLLVETNSGWGIETIQRVVGHPIARETGFCRRLAAILEDYLARPADDSR